MSRIPSVDPKTVKNPETKTFFDTLQRQMGRLPNMFTTLGNSPAALKAYMSLTHAVNETSLSPQLRQMIALTVGQVNGCEYCLAAHSALAKMLKVPDNDIMMARRGEAMDPKTKAVLHFCKEVVEKRGKISQAEFNQLKQAGVTDQEIPEIMATIAESIFTNYFNSVVDTTVDFPAAPKLEMAGAR